MNDLEQHVLELIGENVDSPDVFTDDSAGLAQIRGSLNDAIEEIVMVLGGDHRHYTLSLMGGACFYRLDFTVGQFGWVYGIWYPNRQIRLEQTDLVALEAQKIAENALRAAQIKINRILCDIKVFVQYSQLFSFFKRFFYQTKLPGGLHGGIIWILSSVFNI